MYIVYGINNCDTIKKTKNYLNEHEITFIFHDYKKSGISKEKIEQWLKQVSFEKLINKRGTTWRKLSEKEKSSVDNSDFLIPLLMNNNSLIKRPIIEKDNEILLIGFDEEQLKKEFQLIE